MAKRPTTIRELVDSWTKKSDENLGLHEKLELLTVLRDELYAQYQPFSVKPDYMDRLFDWIAGARGVRDKKVMFDLASWLLFVGEEEMKSLYCSSYSGVVTRWIIDESKIDITSTAAGDKIAQAFKQTFFGSMAGMDMGTYCRANGIQGQSFRPDFREHSQIGNLSALRDFLSSHGYLRIVAVEDYVGTGSQMREACKCLGQLTEFPVLLCPMIVAPRGVDAGHRLAKGHISFAPLFPIPNDITVPKDAPSARKEPPFLAKLRKTINRLWGEVQGRNPTQPLYGPFGFGDTGSLLLTYLNCPDNVPPIIHHKSDSWDPLFQRSSREG